MTAMKISRTARKPVFALILPRFEDIFHSYYTGEITKGVNLAASRLNVDFLVHITDRSNHAQWLDPSLLDRKLIDGILFADIDNDLEIVKSAIMRGMPCLVLNNIISDPINYVAVNNYKAAAQVVEEFIKDVKDGKIKAHTFTPQEEENVEQSETQTEKGEAQAEQKTGEGETLETGETPTTETLE